MKRRKGEVPAGTDHAEGAHGDKTHEAFINGLYGSEESEGRPRGENDVDEFGRTKVGRHRLEEDREQHDEAERNSEHQKIDDLDR
ncbi:MAG TPA: hypothetical protein VIP11_25135 [Gemmatimonadaceae bacterium]